MGDSFVGQARLWSAPTFLLVAATALAACSEDECSGLSDCERGFVCVDGSCRPGTIRQPPRPSGDTGAFDGGAADPDGGSTDAPAQDPDSGLMMDTGTSEADAGSADVPLPDGRVVLPNRTEVVARQLSVAGAQPISVELVAYLQDLSGAVYAESTQSFMRLGDTCDVRQRSLVSGQPERISVADVRIDAPGSEVNGPVPLFHQGDGVYRPNNALFPGPFFIQGNIVTFQIRAATPGAPPPGLQAFGPVAITAPLDLQNLNPPPAIQIDLSINQTFRWNPLGPANAQVFLRAETEDGEVQLLCVISDNSEFSIPMMAADAFQMLRGSRPGNLDVFRLSSQTDTVDRIGGGTEDVAFRIELGTRYRLR